MTLTDSEKLNYILDFKLEFSDILPSDYAEKHRYMTSEVSKFTGPYRYKNSPYIREIVDCLSPYSPVTNVAVMKGLQIGLSAGLIENGIAYLIGEDPTNIMLVSGDAGLVPKMMMRIDQAIDTCGLRDLMGVSTKRKSKASGDTATEKRFAGGSLISYGGQAINKMRQNSVKVIFADDCEAFKGATSAGSFTKTMEGRTASYGNSKKIFYISTPEEKNTSIIEPIFLRGDQRRYFLPCPCCGEYITLEWYGVNEKGESYGVMFDVKNKRVVDNSVRYKCPKCQGEFKEGPNKEFMLNNGEWRPTAEPRIKNHRSYHISSLYAAVGMNSWTYYANMFNEIHPRGGVPNVQELKSFNTNYLGLTWEDRGEAPKSVKIQNNTRSYNVGEIPFDLSEKDGNGEISMLTMAVDLNGEADDARIDWEVCAHSVSGSTYSVDHGSIGTFMNTRKRAKGYDNNRDRWSYKNSSEFCVWDELTKVVEADYSGWKIDVTGIDSNGIFENFAKGYVFIMKKRGFNIIALRGEKTEAFRNTEDDSALYKKSKKEVGLFLVNGNTIKNNLSQYMNLEPYDEGQPPHFMNFPNPIVSDNVLCGKYTYKDYFNHYEGEKKVLKDGSNGIQYYLWERKQGGNNHYWDCRIYNIALCQIFGDELVGLYRKSPSMKSVRDMERNWNNLSKLALHFRSLDLGLQLFM